MGSTIDWTAARFFFDLVQVLGLIGVSVYAWWLNRTQATGQAIIDVGERVDDLERRVDGVDHDLRHRPGTDDLRDLWRKLEDTSQELARATSTNEALAKQLSLVHQHLLEQRK